MIKIKNIILNENKIEFITNETIENGLYVVTKSNNYNINNATFEDIEWNYGTTELEELKLDYSAVVTGYKKLEEEHKELVETNYDLATKKAKLEEENKKYKKKFDKLKKYILHNANYNDFLGDVTVGLSTDNCSELLKIIDGE